MISATAGAVTSVRTPVARRTGRAAEHKLRTRTVGVAVLFAEVQVDAAREQPPAPRSSRSIGFVVGRRARHAESSPRAAASAARPACRQMTRRAAVVAGARGTAAAPACPSRQSPKAFSTSGRSSASVDLAGHDQRGVVRHEVLRPERSACRRASSPCSTPRCRARCSRRDAPVRRARRPSPRWQPRRVLALLHEARQAAGALALDLLGGKLGRRDDVGQERRASPGTLRVSDARRDLRWRPSSTPVVSEPPSCATSSAICSADCESPCPSSSMAAVKFARPGLSAGSLRCRSSRTRRGRHDRQARPLVDEHREPVRQLERRRAPARCSGRAAAGLRLLLAPRLVGVDRLGARRPARPSRASASAPARRDPARPARRGPPRARSARAAAARTPSPRPASRRDSARCPAADSRDRPGSGCSVFSRSATPPKPPSFSSPCTMRVSITLRARSTSDWSGPLSREAPSAPRRCAFSSSSAVWPGRAVASI